jgi:hypothetical protein
MFENKEVRGLESKQGKNEKGQWAFLEEYDIKEYSPEVFVKLLNEGPCEVFFNRVSSGGMRRMRCVKPPFPSSRSAYYPRLPTLISVVDLDEGDWRSFYYEQVAELKRIKKSDLNYQQRKIVATVRGQDWDYMYPGSEGYSLRGEGFYENFKKFRDTFMPKPKGGMPS